jgi:DNA-binding beta-propeller fold protein YncE
VVHGGQQPISGAKIYLLAANPAGYGSPSLSLLTSALTGNAVDSIGAYGTTGTTGSFSVSGDYSCTTGYSLGASTASGGTTLPGNEQVYLYVSGGDPGLGTGVNSNIGLMAALGPCNSQFSSTLQVNEITTVAAAYAFAGFASDATHISSSGSPLALTGLTNAGLNSQNLASVVTGTAAGYGANGIAPSYNTIMIANILASCINGATGNSACYTLFQYTQTAGASGSKATDTASAAIHLAHNPYPTAAGVTNLYALTSGTPAFAGGLSTQPNDFTLGIQFSNSNCFNYAAHGLAIDAAGSAWSLGGHGICKFSSTGASLNSYYGFNYGACFTAGQNLAIDTSGNVWVPNSSLNRLCEVSNSGAAISPSIGYPATGKASDNGGLSTPLAIAIDGSGNVWIANQQAAGAGTIGSLSEFSSSGTAKSGPNGFADSEPRAAFYGIAIDVSGNVWASNYNYGSLAVYNPNSGFLSPATTGFYGGGLSNPYGVAIDGSGNVWVANSYNSSLSKFSGSGAAISPTGAYGGYVGGGLNSPYGVAIDSTGNVWVANFNNNSVSEFTNSGVGVTPNPAYTGSGTIYGPVNVAVDGSGDVWVTNSNGSLTEMIGAAGPVVTPVVANLVSPYGTAAVNRP